MKRLSQFAIAACLLLGSTVVWASNDTPVGTWRQIDDVTGKPKSVIKITEVPKEVALRPGLSVAATIDTRK